MAGRRPSILIVEDDARLAEQLRWGLKGEYSIHLAGDGDAALREVRRRRPDVVLLDLCIPPENTPEGGFRVLREVRGAVNGAAVIVTSAVEEREAAVKAVAEGAYDFFGKPVDLAALRVVIARALERQALEAENRRLREQVRGRYAFEGIVGVSAGIQRVLRSVEKVMDSPVTVLLLGESGTGKDVIARAIHHNGSRRDRPFVPVHCGAFPETLLEAELFGHEKGAFTGATAARVGRFEAADGGTLFLDEIGCMSPAVQMKLLRVLEARTVERLGSNRPRPVDIRLIAATNEDLEQKVRDGGFREDLFFRLNVFPLRLPALRDRREDIPLLADAFLERLHANGGRAVKRIAPEARRTLAARDWPGNVRELQNVVEAAALVAEGEVIRPEDLPEARTERRSIPGTDRALQMGLKAAVDDFEKRLLLEAIERAGGVKNRAARDLGLAPSQMKYLSRKHGL